MEEDKEETRDWSELDGGGGVKVIERNCVLRRREGRYLGKENDDDVSQ